MAGGTDKATGKREWIYTASVKGRFQRWHRWSGIALQALLLLTPWVLIHGEQALRLDLPGRRLFVLGLTFTPRDTLFLVLMLLFAAFSLFFFTSLFGRLWCGYACPQTVFLEEWVRPIERLWEGERGARMKRDAGPLGWDKAWRKAGKWLSFAAVAGLVAMTIVSYFAGARALWAGAAGPVAYAFVGVLGAGLLADFAWFREQFCNYLCPYARFQGALTDDESQVVAYAVSLGEPRQTKENRKAAATGLIAKGSLGACIDCNKCVAVCPQGIDIREGYQLECIACARCVDACTGVMDKMGQPSLIQYTTIAETEGRKPRVLRGRTGVYSALLTALAGLFVVALLGRHKIEATVHRAPGTLFQVDADGWTRNTFLLNVSNNHGAAGSAPAPFTVTVSGIPGAEVIAPPIAVAPADGARVPLVVRVPPAVELPRTAPLRITVKTDFDEIYVDTTFKTDRTTGEG